MPLPALMLPMLMSFGPSLMSKFMGDPQKKLRQQMMKLMSPANLQNLTNQYYQQNLASPGMTQAQGQIAAGANATQGNLMANLGSAGLGQSGVGAIMSSLMPSLVGGQQAKLRSDLYGNAQGMAQNTMQQQLAALQGTSGPSQTQQLFAGGLEAFTPFLQQYMAQMGAKQGPTQGYGNYAPNAQYRPPKSPSQFIPPQNWLQPVPQPRPR